METNHIFLTDKQSRQIYSNLELVCQSCVDCCAVETELICPVGSNGKRRRGKVVTANGTVFLCTDNLDLVSSAKTFKKQMQFYAMMLSAFAEIRKEVQETARTEAKRLIHNLSSLTAHVLQELYLLVPQEELGNL